MVELAISNDQHIYAKDHLDSELFSPNGTKVQRCEVMTMIVVVSFYFRIQADQQALTRSCV